MSTMPDADAERVRRVRRMRGLPASRFMRYALVGVAGTAAHYAFLLTAVTLGVLAPAPASAAGALVGALINFVLNALVTFGSRLAWASALRFLATAALAAGANGAAMALLTDGLRLDYRPAQLIVTAALVCLTYRVNSAWTFRASQAP
jgi:putative flippase GtrA